MCNNMSTNINLSNIKKFLSPSKEDLNKTINENPKSAVFKLAMPTLVSLLFLNINGVMDNMWVAGLGPDCLAGVGFILPIFSIIVSVGNGLGVATNALLSSVLSKNNERLAKKITQNSLIITLVLGIIITLFLVIFLNQILLILNVKTALGPALDYGYILFGGMLVFFFAAVVPSILKARGDVTKVTYAMASTSFLNIILDPILIYNLNLGVKGAAIATVFCSFLCCIILTYFIFKDKNNKVEFKHKFKRHSNNLKDSLYFIIQKILDNMLLSVVGILFKSVFNKDNEIVKLKSDFEIDTKSIKELMTLAIPIILESFALSVLGLIFTMLFNIFGTTMDVAIFTIVFKIYYLAIIPGVAISSSAVTIAAYLSTSLNYKKLKEIFRYMIKTSVKLSIIIWIIILILNEGIVMLFTSTHTSAAFNTLLGANMQFMLLTIIPLPIGFISTGILQGLKLGKISFALSVTRSILLEVIFSLIFLFVFHLGTNGIYYGIVCGAIIGSIICLVFARIYSHRFFKNAEANDKSISST